MEEKTPYDDAIDEVKQAIEDFIPRPIDSALNKCETLKRVDASVSGAKINANTVASFP